MQKKDVPYFDYNREKRAYSLPSERSVTKTRKITVKTQDHTSNHSKLPLISPSSRTNNQKSFIFLSPKTQNLRSFESLKQSFNKNEPFFERKKSIDLTESFNLLKLEERGNKNTNNNALPSRKFHFLEDLDTSKLLSKKPQLEEDIYGIKTIKNKYLPYISLCNKNLLDSSIKQNSLHGSNNYDKDKHPSVYQQQENLFLTNVETNKNNDQRFNLKSLVKNQEAFIRPYPLINRGLRLHVFEMKKKGFERNRKGVRKEGRLENIEVIKENNFRNQEKAQYQKINSLMSFAETMSNIINEQKFKINLLLENVSEKFESVVHNS